MDNESDRILMAHSEFPTPRMGALPKGQRRPVREHMEVLSSSMEHTYKIIQELEMKLDAILMPESPEKALDSNGSGVPEMSPLGNHLDALVDRQDRLNGRLGQLIDRLDL